MFLAGKRALVTGSTSGIGLAIARSLRAEGAEVVLSGFGEADAIAALCDELQAVHVPADLSKREGVEALMAGAGPIDILVNNAGMQHVAPVEEFPVDKWDTIIALNLTAAFDACRIAIPHMKAAGWGRIINTASAHSLTASPYKAAYVAAKHGILGLTKVVGVECADTGVTCNAICPGWVLTPLVQKQIEDRAKAEGISVEKANRDLLAEKQPQLQFTTTDQIAGLALFLASDTASNMQGTQLVSDGGWVAQ